MRRRELITLAVGAAVWSLDAHAQQTKVAVIGLERGGGATGQAYVALPEDIRFKVREELRGNLNDIGGRCTLT
jgi:hypothetical protein